MSLYDYYQNEESPLDHLSLMIGCTKVGLMIISEFGTCDLVHNVRTILDAILNHYFLTYNCHLVFYFEEAQRKRLPVET